MAAQEAFFTLGPKKKDRLQQKLRKPPPPNPHAPIQVLRFIDQIDCYLWQTANNESSVLESIPSCFTTEPAIAWYNSLLESKKPGKLSIDQLRRALIKDFGVESPDELLARYDDPREGKSKGYCYSQEFKLKLSYLDEIEGLKEQVKFRNRRAVEDKKQLLQMGVKCKSVILKRELQHESVLKEKAKRIGFLESRVKELERELEAINHNFDGRRWMADKKVDEAVERFQREFRAAGERLMEGLGLNSDEDSDDSTLAQTPDSADIQHLQLPTIPKTVHWPTPASLEDILTISRRPSPAIEETRAPVRFPLGALQNTNSSQMNNYAQARNKCPSEDSDDCSATSDLADILDLGLDETTKLQTQALLS